MSAPIRPRDVPPVELSALVAGIVPTSQVASTPVSGITLDSRAAQPGWLYVALPGTRAHGASFASQACDLGAVAVLTDAAGASIIGEADVPVVVAPDVRGVLGPIAARLFGNPGERLTTFGLTGTNGKTTTTFLLAAALGVDNVATIGTNGFRLGNVELDATRTTVTTPEAPDLQALLAVMAERGAQQVAVEVSSHAMVLGRVGGLAFDFAGFINLGSDHLDFHATQEEYFEAKASLFTPEHCKAAVVNVGDAAGALIAARVGAVGEVSLVTVGSPEADYSLGLITHTDPLRSSAPLRTPVGEFRLELTMPGDYNAQNALLAFALAHQAGRAPAEILAGLASAQVPGRMQAVDLGEGAPLAVVDFAHTPQAVAAALETFGPYRPGCRVIAVLGAGGDRDATKRAQMGHAAAAHADVVIVTDDNPRSEDPALIRNAVAAGAKGLAAQVHNIAGRAEAIRFALATAGPTDVVAILGKGHEQGQILGTTVVQFDDVTVARQQWAELGEVTSA